MKIPQTYFRIPDFFGDDNYHRYNKEEEIPFSFKDPLRVYIGETTVIPSKYGTCTKLKSRWLWRYGFTSGSTSEFYNTSTGSNGSTNITSLGIGITSTSTYYNIGHTYTIEDGYATDGTTRLKLASARFYSYNNWYFSPSVSTVPAAANRALAFLIKESYGYTPDLPSNMYSISGNVITWKSSPVLTLLRGFECTPY